MSVLAHQRCAYHASREAVARCPECGHCYCRECITEHEDRVVCAACLRRLTRPAGLPAGRLTVLVRAGQLLAALLLCWLYFHQLGRVLLAIPSSFHEGTFWTSGPGEAE